MDNLTPVSPSPRFVRGLQAALVDWFHQTRHLDDVTINQLNPDFSNLLRLVELASELPQTCQDAAALIVQCFFWVEGAGHTIPWLPLLTKIIARLPVEASPLRLRLLIQAGQFQRSQHQFAAALHSFQEAEHLAHSLDDAPALAEVYLNQAGVYYAQRLFDAAAERTYQVIQSGQLQSPKSKAVALETLGAIAQDKGKYVQAELYLRQALDWQQQVGITLNTARTMKKLAVTLHSQKKHAAALDLLLMTETLLADTPHQRDQIELFINRGTIYYDTDQLPEAAAAFHQAEQLASNQPGLYITKGIIANNNGCVWRDQGEWSLADSYYQQSLAFYQQAEELLLQANVLGNMAKLHQLQTHHQKALFYFEQALALLQRFPSHQWAKNLTEDYTDRQQQSLLALGEFKK